MSSYGILYRLFVFLQCDHVETQNACTYVHCFEPLHGNTMKSPKVFYLIVRLDSSLLWQALLY
jgi:hypothetical protein